MGSCKEVLLLLTILISIPQIALSQIQLQPGVSGGFVIQPIFLVGEGVYLAGDQNQITAYVQAYYYNFTYRQIGMDCYLNGDENNPTQNCSIRFYPQRGACTISSPQYNLPLNSSNEMRCKIYDPEAPSFYGYINKSFIPLNFSVWFSNYSSTVGEEFDFPVVIKNYGLFTDTYNVTACVATGPSPCTERAPSIVMRSPSQLTVTLYGKAFDPHLWEETEPGVKEVYFKLLVLDASQSSYICVNVSSLTDPNYQQPQADSCKRIKADFKVMPEGSFISFISLILLASMIIFKVEKGPWSNG